VRNGVVNHDIITCFLEIINCHKEGMKYRFNENGSSEKWGKCIEHRIFI
jgi:hypothetical protein